MSGQGFTGDSKDGPSLLHARRGLLPGADEREERQVMKHYLVVANRTLFSEQLVDEVRRRMSEGPCDFYVVVPASHPVQTWTWEEAQDRAAARHRLAMALIDLRLEGARVDGEVSDVRPRVAIADILRGRPIDHVILTTRPAGESSWLKHDLPAWIHTTVGLPVTHVVVEPGAIAV
jgi:GABA permease